MNEWITVARLGRTRGRRGELLADGYSRPERYAGLERVFLFDRQVQPMRGGEPFYVESVWQYQNRLVFKFRGIDDISAAEPLTGAEVRIPADEQGEPPAGEFFVRDLIGCLLLDRTSGDVVGEVTDWLEYGGPPLLQVMAPGGAEVLVPFVKSVCVEIDVPGRRIVVELPEGLRELNP
ncbi:MAG TPA: 16S rRNA processing protein RimM [Solibacterales bacterium]|nr:16S rRNA processing protein RimM [Bryobacterales bacterium]